MIKESVSKPQQNVGKIPKVELNPRTSGRNRFLSAPNTEIVEPTLHIQGISKH